MTPAEWARVLRAGRAGIANQPTDLPLIMVAMLALEAMADEAEKIAQAGLR